MSMAKRGKKPDTGDDAAARQAAEVAVELTEASDLRDGAGEGPARLSFSHRNQPVD